MGPGRFGSGASNQYMGDYEIRNPLALYYNESEDSLWLSAYIESLVTAPLDKMYI
jgi:hypothetical protein